MLCISFVHPKSMYDKSRSDMAKDAKKLARQIRSFCEESVTMIRITFIVEDITFSIARNRHLGRADWREMFAFQIKDLVAA